MIFKEKPADFQNQMEVVACYVEHGGKFVMLHRHAHKSNGNRWGLPAGKVDPGETKEQAMVREICEETGVAVPQDALHFLGSLYVRHEGRDFHYHTFTAQLRERPAIEINPLEHQAFAWASPRESLAKELIFDLNECTRIFFKL